MIMHTFILCIMGFELVDDYMEGIWYDSCHDDQGDKDDEHSW